MIDVFGWEAAIRNISAKGYRKTKNGKHEAFSSDHRVYKYLGTYESEKEAIDAVLRYRINRFVSNVNKFDLDPNNGVVFEDSYVVFDNGMIFNLHGERINGHVNRDGYINGVINGRTVQFHRIIASIFCEHSLGKDYVNHIDGNKTNNNASNLEWVTRSENTYHSFKLGLQTNINGNPVYTEEEKKFIKEHCFVDYKTVADHLGRNRETVRKYMARYRKENKND